MLRAIVVRLNSGRAVQQTFLGCKCRCSSVAEGEYQAVKLKRISRAMEAYLKRTKQHEELMTKELQDFELGKRHLGNIMGMDPDTMTQEDIDRAIAYLLPSGLIPEARPVMKHPEVIFAKRKAAEFDESGRPFHFLFYTRFPNFYQILHDAAQHARDLMRYEDRQFARGVFEPSKHLALDDSRWITHLELSQMLMENIRDEHYQQFVLALDYLLSLPYSYRLEDFLRKYRKNLSVIEAETVNVPEILIDDSGREYVETVGYHKQCVAKVKLYSGGSGKYLMDGEELHQMWMHNTRASLLFPFVTLERLGEFDVEATTDWDGRPPSHKFQNIRHGMLIGKQLNYKKFINPLRQYRHGETARASAVRHGVSKALTAFISDDDVKKLHLSGLLSRDLRTSERSYPGHRGKKNKPRAKKKWWV